MKKISNFAAFRDLLQGDRGLKVASFRKCMCSLCSVKQPNKGTFLIQNIKIEPLETYFLLGNLYKVRPFVGLLLPCYLTAI